LINKETLSADDYSFSGSNVASKARGCAFVGVTMSLSAIIGLFFFLQSLGAFSIMITKYIVPGHVDGNTLYFGIIIPVQNVLLFASSMTLWFLRNEGNNDATYGF
jgi:hypothetical protein